MVFTKPLLRMNRASWAVALVAATLVALGSVGGVGVYAAPILLVLHFLAARNSRSVPMRVVWGLLAAATAAEGMWGLTYVALGKKEPLIWLLPAVVAAAAGGTVIAARG
jgi:hypothetical protein